MFTFLNETSNLFQKQSLFKGLFSFSLFLCHSNKNKNEKDPSSSISQLLSAADFWFNEHLKELVEGYPKIL